MASPVPRDNNKPTVVLVLVKEEGEEGKARLQFTECRSQLNLVKIRFKLNYGGSHLKLSM